MKTALKTLTLVAIGVAIGRVHKRNKTQVEIKILDLPEYRARLNELKSQLVNSPNAR